MQGGPASESGKYRRPERIVQADLNIVTSSEDTLDQHSTFNLHLNNMDFVSSIVENQL